MDGYDILERLGAGGMGEVFKARHRQLNRIVALKMLGRDSLADPESHRRFQTEAEAVARLQHPNIIQVFDVGDVLAQPGDTRRSPYLSLEYVDGGSLYHRTFTPQPPRVAAALVEQVARAVHAAHQVGVVHRDLKPANVLLTRDGTPKVADFGLAKQLEPPKDVRGRYLTQDGVTLGTPEYMAPEQIDGAAPTPAIDIYALGVMLYELLTARVPFKGQTVIQTMLMAQYEEPVPPSRLQPGLPRDLETICLKCMAKSPDGRYASASELADDLARWLDGRPILARPVGVVERAGRWAKRNPTAAGFAAFAVLLGLAGVGGVMWKWQEAERNATLAGDKAREADDGRRAVRWELYRSNIAVASASLEINTLNATRQALQNAPEEHRYWEWEYFRHQLDSTAEQHTFPGEEVQLVGVTGRHPRVLLRIGGAFRIWDTGERREVARIPDAGTLVSWKLTPGGDKFSFIRGERELVIRPLTGDSPDVVLTGHEGTIHGYHLAESAPRALIPHADGFTVCDTDSGRVVSAVSGLTPTIRYERISPDGRFVAVLRQESKEVSVYDADTGGERFSRGCSNDFLSDVRFSPCGRWVVGAESYPTNVIRVWDLATGDLKFELEGHENEILQLRFTAAGDKLITSSMDQTARIWDLSTGTAVVLHGHSGRVYAAVPSPDDRLLATGGEDQTIRLWDLRTGLALATLRGHTDVVQSIAFTPDGRELVSTGQDGTVRYWDVLAAEWGGVCRGHTDFVYDVAYHPSGRFVASAAWDGTVRVWRTADGKEELKLDQGWDEPGNRPAAVSAVAYSPDGTRLAGLGRNNQLHLWDSADGTLLHTWGVPSYDWMPGRLAFSPDGRLLACGCSDGAVRLLDVAGRTELLELPVGALPVRSVAFSPNGRWLAAGSEDGEAGIRVWDVAEPSVVHDLKGHTDCTYALTFSRDGGTLISGSTDETVRFWNTADWRCETVLKLGAKVYGLSASPDGRRLACGCVDRVVRLIAMDQRKTVAELRGHGEYVHSVAFSPDGKRIASASGDKTVRLWDSAPIRSLPKP